MRIISHRGNIKGPSYNENIKNFYEALKYDFDLEIDVREKDNSIWIGHEYAKIPFPVEFLYPEYISKMWLHMKDMNVGKLLPTNSICFSHDSDDFTYVMCGKRLIWLHPDLNCEIEEMILDSRLDPKITIVLDIDGYLRLDKYFIKNNSFYGVCTDWPIDWQKINFGDI